MNLDGVFNDKVIPWIVCDFDYLIISCSSRTEVALNASDALEKMELVVHLLVCIL